VSQPSDLVPGVLEEYGGIAREALRDMLEGASRRDPLYRLAADYPLRGGRALRASYCIAAARVFGATIGDAAHCAVSLELLHNAFLVHDDVEDDSEERRGRPSLHVLHGVPTAVNVGDALTLLGLRPLLRNRIALGNGLALRILEETEHMVRESIEGQALELRWRDENASDLRDEDYLRLVLKKTCWYTTIYPSRVGALIGTRGRADLDRFIRFGFFLGAAFQIQDDLLNLLGEHARYGKELNGDLAEGKRTLMLIHVMRHATRREREHLEDFLARPRAERSPSEVRWLRGLMGRCGSIDHAQRVAHALAGAATHEFAHAYAGTAPSRDRDFIAGLPHWVLQRA
jgi:geranylgeranyl diphosphate synthase, type II